MAVKFDDIENDFSELGGFVLRDLGIITNASEGGNYAAALLIVAACEALGTLRYGKKDGGADFFRDYLVPEKWCPVVNSIYDALRNGLAHSFSTKVILTVSDKPIELGISWTKEIHFEYDSRRATLFINVQQLSKDLHRAFERYESELRGDTELGDRYVVWRKRQRAFEVKNENEKEAWKALIR